MQHQITVSPEFFKKERNNYSSWRSAFFRELFQNAIDAGADNIDISFKDNGKMNSTIVNFSDDGTGFNSDVRDNVFFCLGETNKGGINDVGGFGKARIVVCFSQNNYQIISQDWRVTGEGGSYDIHELKGEPYKGCSVTVDVDAESYDLDRALCDYLRASYLTCKVTVNGTEWNDWCYKRKLTQRLSFGDVYVNKSGGTHQGYVVVRVKGIPMFTRYTGCNAQVVVEIDANRSREVLLSNRDMLHSKYQTELDEFIRKISIDTKSGLRQNRTKWICSPGQAKVTRRKPLKQYSPIAPNPITKKVALNPTAVNFIRNSKNPVEAWKNTVTGHIITKEVIYNKIDDLIPSAINSLESENPKVRKVFPRYDMRQWYGADDGGNRKKLLRQWTMICDIAVEEYLEYAKVDSMAWRPGFIFSDDSAAQHNQTQNGEDVFLLNPVDNDGKIQFGLRSKDSWTKMILLACHEVAHHYESYHNESFVLVSEHLFEKLFCRREEIFRALKKSLQKEKILC